MLEAAMSAGATTSGPRTVSDPCVSTPSSSSGFASQYGSARFGRQRAAISRSSRVDWSSGSTTVSRSPRWRPRAPAADSEIAASIGLPPDTGQWPAASSACRSIPAYEATSVRSASPTVGRPTISIESDRATWSTSPPPGPSTSVSTGRTDASSVTTSRGGAGVRTRMLVSAGSAARNAVRSPPSVTASP